MFKFLLSLIRLYKDLLIFFLKSNSVESDKEMLNFELWSSKNEFQFQTLLLSLHKDSTALNYKIRERTSIKKIQNKLHFNTNIRSHYFLIIIFFNYKKYHTKNLL